MRRFLLLPFASALIAMSAGAYASCIGPYPPSTVSFFKQHCGKDAYLTQVCGCVIDAVQKTIPLADFIEAGSKQDGLNADPRFTAATKGCMAKYPRTSPPAAPAALHP